MSIEELFETLERYVRESAEGYRKLAMAQHSLPDGRYNPAPSGRIPVHEIIRRAELDREQRAARLQARRYNWIFADQAHA
jgi:hypothetical protein